MRHRQRTVEAAPIARVAGSGVLTLRRRREVGAHRRVLAHAQAAPTLFDERVQSTVDRAKEHRRPVATAARDLVSQDDCKAVVGQFGLERSKRTRARTLVRPRLLARQAGTHR